MKPYPVLKVAITISLIIEALLAILYLESDHFLIHLARLAFQIVISIIILRSENHTGLFLLMAYHILSGLLIIYIKLGLDNYHYILIGYHFIIGSIIYFYDWIEDQLGLSLPEVTEDEEGLI